MIKYIIFKVDEDSNSEEVNDLIAYSEIDPKTLVKLCEIGFSTFKKNKSLFGIDDYNIRKAQYEILLEELDLLPK